VAKIGKPQAVENQKPCGVSREEKGDGEPSFLSVEIAAKLGPGGNYVTVTVADTGIGMNAVDLKHLFEKYFRPVASNSVRQSGMSMGLGLFICAKFMRGMGGDIWVERTAPGEGSVIAIKLPLAASGVCVKPSAEPAKPGRGD